MIWLYSGLALLAAVSAVAICFGAWTFRKSVRLLAQNQENDKRVHELRSTLASIRVKHGLAWETFLPMMSQFEAILGPKDKAIFLGKPIDLIYFNKDEVLFVEIKTGNSRLSVNQKRIKELVQEGKVRWVEVTDDLKFASPATDRTSLADTKRIPLAEQPEQHSESKS